jgi:hypothetical protein
VSAPELIVTVDTVVLSTTEFRDYVVSFEAQRAGVPVEMALAVSHAENGSGLVDARSYAGAIGIMQVMPYKRDGVTPLWLHAWRDDCYGTTNGMLTQLEDPWRNACIGNRILLTYFRLCNDDWDCALRKYNGAERFKEAGDLYIASVLSRLSFAEDAPR